jgi:uncharacterized RDD family membrane protein YckC
MADLPDHPPPGSEPPERPSSLPLPARLLGGGARGARRVAQVTGLERTVEAVTEEAIVRAVESPAVERALARVLRGPVVEEAMQDAMNSAAVERALTDALDSELVDNVWRRLLASDEAQQLVERIAEAPELRSAIAAQSVGFLDDIRRQVRKAARRLDDVVERIARRLFRRPRRVAPPEFAGLITRGLAVAVDIGILNVFFLAISALIAIVASLFVSGNVAAPAVAAGLATWVIAGGIYAVAFWALASQTPGMRFLGIRLEVAGSPQIGARVAFRRLLGTVLAVIPVFLGFLGVILSERRHGLNDRIAHTDVLYMPFEREAPWAAAEDATSDIAATGR